MEDRIITKVIEYRQSMKIKHLLFTMIAFGCFNPKTETQGEVKVSESRALTSGLANSYSTKSSNATSSISPVLVRQNIFQQVEVLIPSAFKIMNDEMIALKYPLKLGTEFLVYTDEDATINLAFEHTPNRASLQELPALKLVFEQQFNQPGIDFQRSELRSINGKDFIVVEMITPAVDTKVYNLLFVTSSGGRLLLGTFNCTVDNLNHWKPLAMQIVSSVRVKD